MVKVVVVPPDWTPPPEGKFAIVGVAKSGTAYFSDLVRNDENRLFRVNNDAPDIANAIDEARDWAARHGAEVVYISRPDGSPSR